MERIEKMLACRALFLEDISEMSGHRLENDEVLTELMVNFFENYFWIDQEGFNLIYYCTYDEEGNVTVTEDKAWSEMQNVYLNYFKRGNNKAIIAILDEIGAENVEKISALASMFVNHILTLYDMNNTLIKS